VADRKASTAVLKGTISKINYLNADGPFTVARLRTDGAEDLTIVGPIFPLSEGEELEVSGAWRLHPRYGLQLEVQEWRRIEPASLAGIERYLSSGFIKGIGPVYARRLVSAFGLETLNVLSTEPHRLTEVPGIGKVRAERILRAWDEHRGLRDAMIFLQGHGMGASLAARIYRVYGERTIANVKADPYALARDIHGVGFVLADRLAQNLGIESDAPSRIEAGVLHVLEKSAEEGHCFAPLGLLRRDAVALLAVREESVDRAATRLAEGGAIVTDTESEGAEERRIYLRRLYEAEARVARTIRALLAAPSILIRKGVASAAAIRTIDLYSPDPFRPVRLKLEDEQRDAVDRALKEKVLVVTGRPGTGKTTLLLFLLALLRKAKVSFALTAPTGRAAKRMGELTGEEAKTIHRLLEYSPHERKFQRDASRPIDADIVIVDEASMIDLTLMDGLLQAAPREGHLLLLGDVDQLPSVGPGSVLKDLIESGIVPVVVLRRIFRQAVESLIVTNAHRILDGNPPRYGSEDADADFLFVPRAAEQELIAVVKELVSTEIPRRLSLSRQESVQAIQVLTPVHRGLLGTQHMNRELQQLLNPGGTTMNRGGQLFRVGDKVMQIRNNYEKGVFNGDLGRITRLTIEDEEVEVDFYGKTVAYGPEDVDELSLAYATSIHKSQGSEYRAVVVLLHTSHYLMLHRSILYTAITRGRELVVVAGSPKALAIAVNNARVDRRFTGLKEKLLGVGSGPI
jgi:exodeoxyribonuclease V alpha subunit